MSNRLEELLKKKTVLLTDGATGTNLFALGLVSGDSPEFWNVDHPDRVKTHYQSFIDAGSDIILTNTFGGSRYRLMLHDGQDRVHELNAAGASLLRELADATDRPIIVAGSMGPTGEILEPAGNTSIADATDAFAEQAQALADGGADCLWIETLSSVEEVQAAVAGASTTDLPLVVTLSIDTNGRTMMGVTPADIVNLGPTLPTEPTAIGTNCGLGAAEVIAAIVNMNKELKNSNTNTILVAKGNCGIPQWNDGAVCYNGTPELMSEYVKMAIDAGAQIVGGCCGSTPVHVAAMRASVDSHERGEVPTIEQIEALLGEVSAGAKAQMQGDLSVAGGSVSGGAKQRSKRRRRR